MSKNFNNNQSYLSSILNHVKKIQVVIMLCALFLITSVGCNRSDISNLNNNKTDITLSKNEKAIQTVLNNLYTSPNEDIIRIMEKMKSNGEFTVIGPNSEKNVSTENIELKNTLYELYGPYFTDKAYDSFVKNYAITNAILPDTYGYQIKVDSVSVKKDEKDPIGYSFIVYLNYGKDDENRINGEVSGSVQCIEEGKISYIRFVDDSGMTKKIIEDK